MDKIDQMAIGMVLRKVRVPCGASYWLAAALTLGSNAALAGDPALGMALFNDIPDAAISCGNSTCHGPNPNDNVNGLQAGGNNPGVIQNAIKMGVTQMMFLNGLLNPFQLDDISAYLAPQPDLSGNVLDFGVQSSGTASAPQSVTLHNTGGVNLEITSVALTGPNAGDFSLVGSCRAPASLPSTTINQAGGSCAVGVTFHPSATGARQATVTLTYAGATTFPASQSVALSGLANVALVPAATISTEVLDFGELLLGESSAPLSITIANPGTAILLISDLELFGQQSAEFALSGSCTTGAFPVAVTSGSQCIVQVGFTPQGIDIRRAALRIHHNAAGNPGFVSISGVGVAPTCTPPAPVTESRIIACPVGQQGTMTQVRRYVCEGATWMPSPWITQVNSCQASIAPADLTLVEYFNAPLSHYFATADLAERRSVESGGAGPGWSATGASLGRVWSTAGPSEPGRAALAEMCRFYGNTAPGPGGKPLGPNSHFYTADPDECAAVKSDLGWIYEGVVFHVVTPSFGTCAQSLVPVYRMYNGRYAENDSNHRYTIDAAIVAAMTNDGWLPEGVVFCVAP